MKRLGPALKRKLLLNLAESDIEILDMLGVCFGIGSRSEVLRFLLRQAAYEKGVNLDEYKKETLNLQHP